MRTKSIPALIKAAGVDEGLDVGQFTAYASVFGTVDAMGDVVESGAFANTLTDWEKSGAPIPVYWSHQMSADPLLNLGHVLSANEDDHGLLVTAQLDVEHNEKAAYTYQLMKGRRVKEMSFAYDVLDSEERDGGGLDLKELKLHEVSVVPVGANPDTEVLDVKSEPAFQRYQVWAKAGRVISAKNEATLRAALDSLSGASKAITEILSMLGDGNNDQGQASGTGAAKSDERGSEKLDELTPNPSVDAWVAELSFYQMIGK